MFLKECRISKTHLPNKNSKKNNKLKNRNNIFKFFKMEIIILADHLLYKIYHLFQTKNIVKM